MQALSSSLDYKTVDKNYVAEKWTTGIDTEQEQMLPGNRGVDKLPTRRRYLFSWAKLALDSVHTIGLCRTKYAINSGLWQC